MQKPAPDKIDFVYDHLATLAWMPKFPTLEHLRLIAGFVAQFAQRKPQAHANIDPSGGEVCPVEWLANEIALRCQFFPTPAEMRTIYAEFWTPLDEKNRPRPVHMY